MTHQPQPSGRDLLDIVFENRNQAYGAYALRRSYPANLARALGTGILLLTAFISAVHLATLLGKRVARSQASDDPVIFTASDFSRVQQPLPELPKAASAVPSKAVQRFVPLVVVADEQAPELEGNATIADLTQSNSTVGATNQTGVSDGPPDLVDGLVGTFGSDKAGASSESTVYEAVDVQKMPSFPGGEQELLRYLARHIQYPTAARVAGIASQAVVSFVVNADGSISEIAVLKDPGGGCGKEVVRVVSAMPHWMPGEANGHPVRVRFFLPVRFELR
ncbi:MAG: energy transducer TonB [Lewinellaceae bacterium]|nr:energy transducer TonB [Lewinellaceae bacterium]